jgi:hypothetical protein
MSDIHVLEGTRNKGQITKRLVFHYLVPPGDRVVNAVYDTRLTAFVSAVPNIKSFPHPTDVPPKTEMNAVREGIVIEVEESYTFYQGKPPSELLAQARALYDKGEAEALKAYWVRYYEYLSDFAKS